MQTEDLRQVVEDVCQSMLGLHLSNATQDATATTSLVASVSITGEWNAILEVAVCREAATAITAAMFAMEPEDTSDEEVFDAVSEVANMIGGNIKGMIGGDCNLSLPCVGDTVTESAADAVGVSFELSSGVLQVFFKQRASADTTELSAGSVAN